MTSADLVLTARGLRFLGRYFPCSIGRSGVLTQKLEGDGGTPSGTHIITGCLYRPDRMHPPNGWATAILPGDLWSDDVNDADYNHLVRAPHPFSHEMLRRADPLYDIVLLTNWNWPHSAPGKGSAIFIHQWRKPRHPTEGCIALDPVNLRFIAGLAVPGTRLIVR